MDDHPLRYHLANELHARPYPIIDAPATAVFVAIKQPVAAVARDRSMDLAHLIALLDRYGAPHPRPGATHYSGEIGRHMLKWEQHTEFVTYTAVSTGVGKRAFDPAEFEVFPSEWLAQAPGERLTSVLVRVETRLPDTEIAEDLAEWFVPESLTTAHISDEFAVAAGDYRIDPAGHIRFALFAPPGSGKRWIGSMVQRLCEIETYKTMALLGFSRAQSLSHRIGELDKRLTELMSEMTEDDSRAEEILPQLLVISSELEKMSAQAAFRLGATRAYRTIVDDRIDSMRETRWQAMPLMKEFMTRRFAPAMRTVEAIERRMQTLSDRAMRASDLLRTRVDVERSAQNQALLESMDRRADMQLRLQHTVEGLSVVAISYYAVSLVSYLLYPMASGLGMSKGTLTAIAVLPVVAAVWLSLRRIRKSLH